MMASISSFCVEFTFPANETKDSYHWALSQYLSTFNDLPYSDELSVTDNDDVLIASIASNLPDTKHLLCR